MAEIKKSSHTVIKHEDLNKYLTGFEVGCLHHCLIQIYNGRIKDGKQGDNEYYICNKDEPYAQKVLDVILQGEDQKKEGE